MKIASLIAAYNPDIGILERVANALSRTDVFIFSQERQPVYGEFVYTNKALGEHFVFQPRKWILEHLDEYDFFYYSEDDLLTGDNQLRWLIDYQRSLPDSCISGFLRYEFLDDGQRSFIDLHPTHSIHTGGNGQNDIIADKQPFGWRPYNVHSGNFLICREGVKELIANNRWDSNYLDHGIKYCGCLESGASSIYRSYQKYLPYDYGIISVEHLNRKYGERWKVTDEDLQKLL